MQIDRILLTGDAFRTVLGEPLQAGNVEWLARHFGAMLHAVTALPVESRFPLNAEQASIDSVRHWVGLQGGLGLENWAREFWGTPTPALCGEVERSAKSALVVGIELSPLMIAALDSAGVPWIDVGVSPLRFLADYVIHLRASAHFDLRVAPDCLLSSEQIGEAVNRVSRNYCAVDAPLDDTVIFFAQTRQDRTTIADGRFCGLDDAITLVEPILRGRRLLVKPHPWEPENPIVNALLQQFDGEITNLNTYCMLSSRHRPVVATLSSSVGIEARAFGCPTYVANPGVQDWAYSGVDSLFWGRSARLWAPILSQLVPVKMTQDSSAFQANQLRDEIGAFGLESGIWS